MYFITIKRMLEVCFSAHPNIQYRAKTVYIVPKIRYNSLYCVITQGYIKYEMKEY